MWKSWSLFKKRSEENTDLSVNRNEGSGGKENIVVEVSRRGLADLSETSGNSLRGSRATTNGDFNLNNYGSRQVNSSAGDTSLLQFSHEDDTMCEDNTVRLSPRKRNEVEISGSPHAMRLGRSPTTKTSPFTHSSETTLNLSRGSNTSRKYENSNTSFSGVYGPLLSTPIVPKVRRALEANGDLRSPQSSFLMRGKQVGRSPNLNYGSGNPTKSTAGHVPWVRLKRRESLTLSDIVSGNMPKSPNTVKLAAPELRLLPSAPSFKTTPVIVTTEHSRARMVDTQTVVSALREKRKRFGVNQREDSFSEDSWISSAKRRRQDSSQSNASSVSIPSMPESLPNLMGTPGVSLLHIENLKDQRPSTVPAMDAFVSRHQREYGLGGEILGHKPQLQAHNYQQQLDEQDIKSKQSGKSVLRSIQSSLSSSLRARSNLSVLQQSGLDLSRIRQPPEISDDSKSTAVFSDTSAVDQSAEEPQPELSRLVSSDTIILPSTTDKTLHACSAENTVGTVSSQTKQKIADGVVLRKNNMSFSSSIGMPRSKQILSLNTHVSTVDFEQDRQKEYKRRVLDILDEDEAPEKRDVRSTVPTTIAALITSSVAVSSNAPTSIEASLAATSAAVSASLDSLNKLVQSATAAMPSSTMATSIASANSLTQLLQSSNDKSTACEEQAAKVSDSTTSTMSLSSGMPAATTATLLTTKKDLSFGDFITSTPSSQNASTESVTSKTAPIGTGGFKFGVFQTTATVAPPAQIMPLSTAEGLHMNFLSSSVPTSTLPIIAAASIAPSGTGFNFNSGIISSSIPNTNFVGSITTGSGFSVGVPTATSKALESESKSMGSLDSASQNSESSSKIASTHLPIPGSQGSSMFSSGISQGLISSSGSFSLSSTLQAFAKAQSGEDGPFTRQGISSSQSQASAFPTSSIPLATTPASIPPSSLFNFANTTSLPSGLNFGNTGGATSSVSNLANVSVSSTSSAANSASANQGFNFGTMGSVIATSSHQLGGISFGMVTTNSLGITTTAPAGWTSPAASLGASGFNSQSANPVFKGFGSNTQTTASTAAFPAAGLHPFTAVTSVPSLFGSTGAPFATNSQTPVPTQQPFGSTTTSATFSLFGVTTTASNNIAFGQAPAGNVTAKPFSFGAVSTQSGAINSFGSASTTATTSSSIFGNIVSSSGPSTIFGSGTMSAFGSGTVSSQFGSSVPTSSPPAFGSTLSAFGSTSNQASSVFGTGAQPAVQSTSVFGAAAQPAGQSSSVFGAAAQPAGQSSSVFGAAAHPAGQSTSVFGAAAHPAGQSTSVFGAAAHPAGQSTSVFGAAAQPAGQSTSLFGAAAQPAGQPTSMFGVPVSSSNKLFTFGPASGGGSQSTPQQVSAFTSNPVSTFGSNPTPSFGSNSTTVFGSNTSTFGSVPTTTYGASLATTFGSNPVTSFGSMSSAAGSSLFGTKPVAPAFGTATSNPAPVFGAPTQGASTVTAPGFGSSFGISNTFGTQQSSEKSAFGNTGFGAPAIATFGATSQSSTFGVASQNSTQNIFGSTSQTPAPAFGTQQSSLQTANSGSFGGSGPSGGTNFFAAAKPNMFGTATTTTTTQSSFNFGTTQPNLFTSQTTGSGFNFGQPPAQSATSSNVGLNFGAQTPTRPSFQAPSNGFNFAAAAGSTPTFNFSGAPSTPNPFNSETPTAVPRPRATVRRPNRRGGARR